MINEHKSGDYHFMETLKVTARNTQSAHSPWPSAEERSKVRDQKIEAVLDTALSMFLELGYHHVKMADVAKRLSVTKPALYNYFRSKEEILFECWMSGFQQLKERMATIDASETTGLDRLRRLIRIYAETMTTNYGKSLIRFDDRDFDPANKETTLRGKRDIDRVFRTYISQGMADGSIVNTDPKMTAFAIAGALNWIGHWYRLEQGLTPEQLGADFAERLTAALKRD